MRKTLVSWAAYLAANTVGLMLATILLDGFRIGILAFLLAVVIFSVAQAILTPLLTRLSRAYAPQVMGGIALVTVFFGLLITDLIMADMAMGGLSNWLAATLLVWLGSLIAQILLPIYVFKEKTVPRTPTT